MSNSSNANRAYAAAHFALELDNKKDVGLFRSIEGGGVKADVMENKTFAAYIERSGEDYKRLSPTPDQYDAFVEQISHMWMSEPAWSDTDLARITVPTAIVLGDHDEAIKLDHTEHMAKVIPGAELIILKDASHFAMLQDPAGYDQAVLAFLAK